MRPPQPRIPVQPMNSVDWILELLAAGGAVLLLASMAYYLPRLPAEIPSHFGFDGVPDAVGSRASYIAVPFVALCVYAVLTVVARRPNWLNYPHKLTDDNAADAYRWIRRFLALLKIEIVWMLGIISLQIARISLGRAETLPLGVTPFLVVVFATVGWYLLGTKRRWGPAERLRL